MTKIRRLLPALLAASIAAPAFAGPDGGVSTPMLSRCAGKAGLETRQSDAAFGLLALDGAPWLSIEPVEGNADTGRILSAFGLPLTGTFDVLVEFVENVTEQWPRTDVTGGVP